MKLNQEVRDGSKEKSTCEKEGSEEGSREEKSSG
jgi:hypothetical protein